MNAVDKLMQERINWGGVLLTRAEAVQDMRDEGFDERAIVGLGGPFARPAISDEIAACWWPELVGLDALRRTA